MLSSLWEYLFSQFLKQYWWLLWILETVASTEKWEFIMVTPNTCCTKITSTATLAPPYNWHCEELFCCSIIWVLLCPKQCWVVLSRGWHQVWWMNSSNTIPTRHTSSAQLEFYWILIEWQIMGRKWQIVMSPSSLFTLYIMISFNSSKQS